MVAEAREGVHVVCSLVHDVEVRVTIGADLGLRVRACYALTGKSAAPMMVLWQGWGGFFYVYFYTAAESTNYEVRITRWE